MNDSASPRRSRPAGARRLAALAGLAIGLALPAGAAAWPMPIDPGAGAAVQTQAGVAPATPGSPQLAPSDADIALSQRVTGLSMPVLITSANDGTDRFFIVEQTGRIKIWNGTSVLGTPFLSLAGKVSTGFEQGLLGLAFHPNYESNRKLYIYFTNKAGNAIVREYRASASNPNVVDTSTKRKVLKMHHPYDNHNGGMLLFGPDGYLYIGTGDGGSRGDPGNRAQDKGKLLGKILRINVDGRTGDKGYGIPSSNPYVGAPGKNEIWQRGLRNPWRFSFDRANGDLWIGDVGQDVWEEINRANRTSTGAGRGKNWGWRVMEGTHCYRPSSGCDKSGKTKPVTEYKHSSGRCSVTGGYVYRGSSIPALVGGYLYADYCSGEIWVIGSNASKGTKGTRLLDTNLTISSFGERPNGELFVVDHGGRIYSIVQG